MNVTNRDLVLSAPPAPSRSGDVVEVSLLLEARQLAALEAAAHAEGLTAARMTRRLILDYLRRWAADRPRV